MSDESSKRPVGTVGKRPETASRTATASTSAHSYRLVVINENCTAYTLGDLVTVYVNDPPPAWTPIDLGGNCNECVGVLDE